MTEANRILRKRRYAGHNKKFIHSLKHLASLTTPRGGSAGCAVLGIGLATATGLQVCAAAAGQTADDNDSLTAGKPSIV